MWIFSCYSVSVFCCCCCLVLFEWPDFGRKKKHLCVHRQPQFGHFSGYHSQKVSTEITWTLFTPKQTKKKQESHPVLATSICFSLIFDFLFPSLSVACYCCVTKIFLRNVHECLQCPPHWNTWGKVSSLTLWSIPAPQLEPQLLVPPLLRIFFFLKWWAIFFYSSRRIGFFFFFFSKLVGLGVVFEKKSTGSCSACLN